MTSSSIVTQRARVDPTLEPVTDVYADEHPAGRVIGSMSTSGAVRKGADARGVLRIDHGALRIGYTRRPGWGRHAIAYGPYPRRKGLAFASFLLNGHNNSQSYDKKDSTPLRLARRMLYYVSRMTGGDRIPPPPPHPFHWPPLKENCAVGWFPEEAPENPFEGSSCFLVHATGPDCGELQVMVAGRPLTVLRNLQNLPMYLVAVLRETGVAYYASCYPGAGGMTGYPFLRPLAIDAFADHPELYGGIHQGILGEVGFRVDTRVYGTHIGRLEEFETWYGSAHLADSLTGIGLLNGSQVETGGIWLVTDGTFHRTYKGTHLVYPERNGHCFDPHHLSGTLAVARTPVPSGLVHVLFDSPTGRPAGLMWRVHDEQNYWLVVVGKGECRLFLVNDGVPERISTSMTCDVRGGCTNALQVLDDGDSFAVVLNGEFLFDGWFRDSRSGLNTGIGLFTPPGSNDVVYRFIEAHPRRLPIPEGMDFGAPWHPGPTRVVVSDSFKGTSGELEGRSVGSSGRIWQRQIGKGTIDVTGDASARVRANALHPNPGRTAYTFDWEASHLADLEVEITPAGTGRGQDERGRGGFIFLQDPDNYLIVSTYLCDSYGGASLSSFFRLNGSEDLYKAVWTNMGDRVRWGVPYLLRVAFDGNHYVAYVDGEPVLYRSLTDVDPAIEGITIRRVGIVANWEWGNDTGSIFRNFRASSKR